MLEPAEPRMAAAEELQTFCLSANKARKLSALHQVPLLQRLLFSSKLRKILNMIGQSFRIADLRDNCIC